MDPPQDQWPQSPNGSGAEYDNTWLNETDTFNMLQSDCFEHSHLDEETYATTLDDVFMMTLQEDSFVAQDSFTFGTEGLSPGQVMSPKVPPAFNGRTSWFYYEELVLDWTDITTLTDEKQGPALRNRLEGDAAVYKQHLDRDELKTGNGVDYFLKTLRPKFVKGAQNVFLWRLLQFMTMRRGKLEVNRWIAKF